MDNDNRKHILVISQYFYPEQFRINDIFKEWVKRGYRVTVVTGIPNYPKGKFYEGFGLFKKRKETYCGIDVVRIPIIPRGSSSIMLALNYLSFVVSGFLWKTFTKIKADYVFIFEVSPMTQALPGVWYAKKRNIPCYLYVQDLWPENVVFITGIKNRHIIGSLSRMVDYIYEKCSRIFTTSESFVRSINARGTPIDKIEYWPQYAEDFYVPLDKIAIPEIPNDGAFNIIFAGNIGVAQGLDILPKAAKIIKEKTDRKVRFNIVGDGRFKDGLIRIIEDMGLVEMFNLIPKQPATKIPKFMAASDAAFLSLTDSPLFNMTIPAKLQTYMACGMPIIASANGETDRVIDEANAGMCSYSGDAEELASKIIEMSSITNSELLQLGCNARKYYDNNFDKQSLLKRMDVHFNSREVSEEE